MENIGVPGSAIQRRLPSTPGNPWKLWQNILQPQVFVRCPHPIYRGWKGLKTWLELRCLGTRRVPAGRFFRFVSVCDGSYLCTFSQEAFKSTTASSCQHPCIPRQPQPAKHSAQTQSIWTLVTMTTALFFLFHGQTSSTSCFAFFEWLMTSHLTLFKCSTSRVTTQKISNT